METLFRIILRPRWRFKGNISFWRLAGLVNLDRNLYLIFILILIYIENSVYIAYISASLLSFISTKSIINVLCFSTWYIDFLKFSSSFQHQHRLSPVCSPFSITFIFFLLLYIYFNFIIVYIIGKFYYPIYGVIWEFSKD